MQKFNSVVLGAGGVGKSALTCRFTNNTFLEAYDPTIEEIYRRTVEVDGIVSQLEVLDTAGAEQFNTLNEVYIRNGMGFLLVFSLTQEASLREVDSLREQIYRIKGGDTAPIFVVGTKSDLTSEREVKRVTAQKYAARWGLPYYETSAKRNWGVTDVFEGLVREMRLRYPMQPVRKKKGIDKCVIM